MRLSPRTRPNYWFRKEGMPNPSLERGPPPAWHLAREALQGYAPPRGPSAIPAPAPQLKR